MKTITVSIDLEYDKLRLSPKEVVFNVRQALDEYFNRYDYAYDEEALRVIEVYENATVLPKRD